MVTKTYKLQGWITPTAPKPTYKAVFERVQFRGGKKWNCDLEVSFLGEKDNPLFLFDKADLAFLCHFLEGLPQKREPVSTTTYKHYVIVFSETDAADRITFFDWQKCETHSTLNLCKGKLPKFIKALKAVSGEN